MTSAYSIAYLIAAHDSPNQTRRLVEALSSPSARFFIHVDAKADQRPFTAAISSPDVQFIRKRVRVFWGDFTQVQATLNMMETACADPVRHERFVLLSGSDFPLRPSSYIERFFATHAQQEFINSVPIPCPAARKPLNRVTDYRVSPAASLPIRVLEKVLLKAGIMARTRDYRSRLGNIEPFAGSSWWALSRRACEYILDFAERNPDVVRFFHNTLCPDEAFFQTALNSSELRTHITRNVTFADWSAGGASPQFLSEKHLDLFKTGAFVVNDKAYGGGEMLFARKFRDADGELVEKLRRQRQLGLEELPRSSR